MCEVIDRLEARAEARMTKLARLLFQDGREEDFKHALEDENYLQALFVEYKLKKELVRV